LESSSEITVFKNANIIDGTGRPTLKDHAMAVKDSNILSVGETREIISTFPNAETIDLSGMTVTPGLIDAHTHVCLTSYTSYFDLVGPDKSLEAITLQALKNANDHLQSGFTTIRDIGAVGNVALAVRNAINSGLFEGPRIVATTQLIGSTGGMIDYYPEWIQSKLQFGRIVNGVDQAVIAVREIIKAGADFIKMEATGGVDHPTTTSHVLTLSYKEMSAVCREAHRLGKRVAVHAEGTEGVKLSLKAGVDTVEHGFFLDNEIIDTMKSSPVVLVATVGYLAGTVEKGAEKGLPEWVINRKREAYTHLGKYLEKALRSGVKIAIGSDCGGIEYPHGTSAYELGALVRLGFSEVEAITAATKYGSEAAGLSNKVGTLESGKLADFIVVEGNPAQDIGILQNRERIRMIFKGGRSVKKAH
jgi:imidazolonepropionase-like amidohydrolase